MIEKVRQERRKIASMSWLLASLLCLGLGSCQHDKATVADYGDKVLPPKDINSPVRTKEARHFYLHSEGPGNGKITNYDSFDMMAIYTYNDEGYLTRNLNVDESHNTTDYEKYEYDFSDKDFSYEYIEYMGRSEKMVYDKKGQLVKRYDGDTNRLLNVYKYNEKGQIVSKIEYENDDDVIWIEKCKYIYDGNITKSITTSNEDDKEVKREELITKYDTNGNVIEEIRYTYGDSKIDTTITKYENGGKKETTYMNGNKKSEILYNSRDDIIEEYDYLRFGVLKVLTRREYDQYGNPTLEYRTSTSSKGKSSYSVIMYDYTYSDGTKFSAKEAFPELFIK